MVIRAQADPDPVDVVIVGAGAAGSLFAAKLAAAGKRVRVFEAGPAWRNSDLYSSQVWGRRLKWGGPPVATIGEHRLSHNMNAGSGFGGAALHHYAVWPRLHAEDFKVRSLYGRGLDWPIAYDDLRPYYDAIQEEVGISGDARAEVWRPPGAPYPMPALRTFRQGDMIAAGFKAVGLRVAPTPLAINSTSYKGRPACLYEGWCEAGCPIGALANPLVTYLAEAQRTGADIRAGCHVVRVVATGGRATAVEYVDEGGTRRTQRASVVLLCAAAVQNAWLLLNSASDTQPRGLANDSGLVGRYLMSHLLGGVSGMFDERTDNHLGVTGGQYFSQDGYDKERRGGPFGSYQWLIAPALKVNDLAGIANTRVDLFGEDLHTYLRRAATQLGTMGAMCESLPDEANRVELDDRRDRFGQPLARLVHRFDADALGIWKVSAEEGRAVMKAARATDVAAGGNFGTAHLMGGTIMGADKTRSVTDSYGRAHTCDGLVIAGSGLFPTGGAVNPTFTINALALRTARHMLEHWNEYAG